MVSMSILFSFNSAAKWTDTSLLKFHPDKCCHMRIGHSSTRNCGYTMDINKNTIIKTEKIKDTGVTFDLSLYFEAYMSEKYNMMVIFRRTFEYLDDKCFPLFLSSLSYHILTMQVRY